MAIAGTLIDVQQGHLTFEGTRQRSGLQGLWSNETIKWFEECFQVDVWEEVVHHKFMEQHFEDTLKVWLARPKLSANMNKDIVVISSMPNLAIPHNQQ